MTGWCWGVVMAEWKTGTESQMSTVKSGDSAA